LEPEPTPTLCSSCGAPAQRSAASCTLCGASLLVDVVLGAALDDARSFKAARALAAMGPPAPEYGEAKRRIGQGPGAVLVARVSLDFASRLAATLSSVEAPTSRRPANVPHFSRSPVLWLVAMSALCVAAGLVAWQWPTAPLEAAPSPKVVEPLDSSPSTREPSVLTPQEIGRRALQSCATVSCGESMGAGFFVESEMLVTNAHVLCSGDSVTVKLRDGRELLGKVQERDDWLDVATVWVMGAGVEALPGGETSRLVQGDSVVFVGSPAGLEFTLHDGKVGFVGRNYLGVGYVQINGTINPGNSGGPLLNGAGEVVGIISMKVTSAEGIGLALPLEYAIPPRSAEALERWSALLKEVAEADGEEIARLERDYGAPFVGGLVQSRDGRPVAVVVAPWADGVPEQREYSLRFSTEVTSCALNATVRAWERPDEGQATLREHREVRWLLRSKVGKNLFVGLAGLEPGACSFELLQSAGSLELVLDEEPTEGPRRVPVARGALAGAFFESGPRVRSSREQRTSEEADWRARFRQVRDRIAALEQRRDQAQKRVADLEFRVAQGQVLTARGEALYAEAKGILQTADADLAQAKEALRDLERSAAHHAVPFEWRK